MSGTGRRGGAVVWEAVDRFCPGWVFPVFRFVQREGGGLRNPPASGGGFGLTTCEEGACFAGAERRSCRSDGCFVCADACFVIADVCFVIADCCFVNSE